MLPVIVSILATTGCTQLAKDKSRTERELNRHSRALTTAVVDPLNSQSATDRNAFDSLALELAREDQRIEGIPTDPIAVGDLLAVAGTNISASAVRAQKRAEADLKARLADVRDLLANRESQDEKLAAYGAVYEQERNARLRRWTGWIGSGTLLAGALIALCIFCPVALPVVGRVIGWVVGKLPGLAGAAGVVSTRAFDAVVSAIQQTRSGSESSRINNHQGPQWDAAGDLELNLSREMDRAHKKLVRSRKAALRL